MKNYSQRGDNITLTMLADVVAGQVVKIGAIVGIASCDGATGEEVALAIEGCYELPKVSADAFAEGAVAKVDGSGVVAAAGTVACGWVIQAAGAGTTTVQVKLTPGIGGAAATLEAETARRPAKSAA